MIEVVILLVGFALVPIPHGKGMTLDTHAGPVGCLAFSPDESMLAVGYIPKAIKDTHTLRFWSIGSRKLVYGVQGSDEGVTSVAFHNEGRLLAVGGNAGSVTIWDFKEKKTIWNLPAHIDRVTGLRFSPKEHLLVSGDGNKIRLWDFQQKKLSTVCCGHTARVVSIDFSPDGQRLFSTSEDRTSRIWNVATGQALATFTHRSLVFSGAISRNGQCFATGTGGDMIKPVLEEKAGWSKFVKAAIGSGEAIVWATTNQDVKQSFNVSPGVVKAVDFSPDGRWLALGTMALSPSTFLLLQSYEPSKNKNGEVYFCDMNLGHIVKARLHSLDYLVSCVRFSPSGRWLAVGGGDGIVRLEEVGDLTRRFKQ